MTILFYKSEFMQTTTSKSAHYCKDVCVVELIMYCVIATLRLYVMSPTILFAPGSLSAASVSVVSHARYSADRIGRPPLLPLPAPFFILPAEATLGDLQPVSITVVSSLFPSVKSVAASIRAVKVIAAFST